MIEIDGSEGEGGGQMVRSSLALALLTGRSFTIENVRGKRKKPGLMRQHLTALNAAVEIGQAKVTGAEIGSQRITFEPKNIQYGDFNFKISSAGSITLVLQTVLPALMLGDTPSRLTLSGGTHNMMAPPFDFLERSFIPQLEKMGPKIDVTLSTYGFYPAGGGAFTVDVTPVKSLDSLSLNRRGKLLKRRVTGIVSAISAGIARRETSRLIRKLNWDQVDERHIEVDHPRGPGNILFAELEYENLTVMFSGFGRMGVSAEKVADGVARDIRKYLKTDAPVEPYLADQLILPMAIGAHFGGNPSQFRTGPLTQHAQTQINIIKKFLDVTFTTQQTGDDNRSPISVSVESNADLV